jgi:hypothetical protein
MIKFIQYFFHLLRHKYFMLWECWREGLYLQGLTHDFSKLRWKEFKSYTERYFGCQDKYNEDFDNARTGHQMRNRHHWHYWIIDKHSKQADEMPRKYLLEMICDWRAISRTWKDSPEQFYRKNQKRMVLHPKTRGKLEKLLIIDPGPRQHGV